MASPTISSTAMKAGTASASVRDETTAWVFVSHSSADLIKVRKIRNFMEEHGAAPILFYLKALTNPDAFWPLIEQEIAARNFFLLCDSTSARESRWVQREWETVRRIGQSKAIRVGRLDLDADPLDLTTVSRFLLNTRVFVVSGKSSVVSAHVALEALSKANYSAWGAVTFSVEGLHRLGDGTQMSDDMLLQLDLAAEKGWLLILLDNDIIDSPNFWREVPKLSRANRLMFICPPELQTKSVVREIPANSVVVGSDGETVLPEAIRRMLLAGSDTNAV